jgi:hypothetical protein
MVEELKERGKTCTIFACYEKISTKILLFRKFFRKKFPPLRCWLLKWVKIGGCSVCRQYVVLVGTEK